MQLKSSHFRIWKSQSTYCRCFEIIILVSRYQFCDAILHSPENVVTFCRSKQPKLLIEQCCRQSQNEGRVQLYRPSHLRYPLQLCSSPVVLSAARLLILGSIRKVLNHDTAIGLVTAKGFWLFHVIASSCVICRAIPKAEAATSFHPKIKSKVWPEICQSCHISHPYLDGSVWNGEGCKSEENHRKVVLSLVNCHPLLPPHDGCSLTFELELLNLTGTHAYTLLLCLSFLSN